MFQRILSLCIVALCSYSAVAADDQETGRDNSELIKTAAQSFFNESVRQKFIPATLKKESSPELLESVEISLDISGQRNELAQQFSIAEITPKQYEDAERKLADQLPVRAITQESEGVDYYLKTAREGRVNALVNAVLVYSLQKNSDFVGAALNMEARNRDKRIPYTIYNLKIEVSKDANEDFYGKFDGNTNLFVIDEITADGVTGQDKFKFNATFFGISMSCGYECSYRFFERNANQMIFGTSGNITAKPEKISFSIN